MILQMWESWTFEKTEFSHLLTKGNASFQNKIYHQEFVTAVKRADTGLMNASQ